MRHYETVFIISPELTEEDTQAVVDKFTGILADAGAVLVKVDVWGRRRLAYVVKKFNKGFYVLLDYGATPEAIAELERNFKIDEQVIRYLTVKKADHFDAEAAVAAAEARKAKAAAEREMEDDQEADADRPRNPPHFVEDQDEDDDDDSYYDDEDESDYEEAEKKESPEGA